MSGLLPAHTFTDSDIVDLRRFCGYGVYGTGVVAFVERWTRIYVEMETRLITLTDNEAIIVQQYLTDLRALQAAIPAAGANLDTDQAAVWTHNKNEIADRRNLYRVWRLELCGFLGIPPGPHLRGGSGPRLVV